MKKTEALLIDRVDDLVAAMTDPKANERVRFAGQVVERHGIDVTSEAGQERARELLVGLRAPMLDAPEERRLDVRLPAHRDAVVGAPVSARRQ